MIVGATSGGYHVRRLSDSEDSPVAAVQIDVMIDLPLNNQTREDRVSSYQIQSGFLNDPQAESRT